MKARIIKIGNSRGIRIPKPLLEQTGISENVDLEVNHDRIIIRPVSNVRSGWENAFKAMAENNDDALVAEAETLVHSWDEKEWQW